MISLLDPNYFSRYEVEVQLKKLGKSLPAKAVVVDLGCGRKPYKKYFKNKYIGVDVDKNGGADIVSVAWNTGLPDNYADAVLLVQSLEHVSQTRRLVKEVRRILKPNGLLFVSVPQTMPNHGPINSSNIHEDYFRFTPGGLMTVFSEFSSVNISQSSRYWSTIFQLVNIYIFTISQTNLLRPIYLFNNILGLIFDFASSGLQSVVRLLGRQSYLNDSLSINYILTARK